MKALKFTYSALLFTLLSGCFGSTQLALDAEEAMFLSPEEAEARAAKQMERQKNFKRWGFLLTSYGDSLSDDEDLMVICLPSILKRNTTQRGYALNLVENFLLSESAETDGGGNITGTSYFYRFYGANLGSTYYFGLGAWYIWGVDITSDAPIGTDEAPSYLADPYLWTPAVELGYRLILGKFLLELSAEMRFSANHEELTLEYEHDNSITITHSLPDYTIIKAGLGWVW